MGAVVIRGAGVVGVVGLQGLALAPEAPLEPVDTVHIERALHAHLIPLLANPIPEIRRGLRPPPGREAPVLGKIDHFHPWAGGAIAVWLARLVGPAVLLTVVPMASLGGRHYTQIHLPVRRGLPPAAVAVLLARPVQRAEDLTVVGANHRTQPRGILQQVLLQLPRPQRLQQPPAARRSRGALPGPDGPVQAVTQGAKLRRAQVPVSVVVELHVEDVNGNELLQGDGQHSVARSPQGKRLKIHREMGGVQVVQNVPRAGHLLSDGGGVVPGQGIPREIRRAGGHVLADVGSAVPLAPAIRALAGVEVRGAGPVALTDLTLL
mmetsp:Transcript_21986/g.49530  ORF Transcript_21986/g.49530 Transcript_21986/m.49530 type:complete len:321 (+) Transcript_21986:535-1497(+)